MKKFILLLLPYTFILAAALFIMDGCWIKVKPVLAQVLLESAWQQTRTGKNKVKPWPWADTWPIARLHVERLDIHYIVLEGESGEVLAFGPGHIEDSSKPLADGNCILLGHRDTSFQFVKELQKGDVLTLEDGTGGKRQYQVLGTEVSDHRKLYFQETDEPWLTLITCYPFDSVNPGGPLRYVVFARGDALSS